MIQSLCLLVSICFIWCLQPKYGFSFSFDSYIVFYAAVASIVGCNMVTGVTLVLYQFWSLSYLLFVVSMDVTSCDTITAVILAFFYCFWIKRSYVFSSNNVCCIHCWFHHSYFIYCPLKCSFDHYQNFPLLYFL